MNKVNFTDFEERLYIACSETTQFERYKHSALMRGILFAVLFAVLAYKNAFNLWILLVMALYSLYDLFEICRFASVCDSYRKIRQKIAARLLERTNDPQYEVIVQESANGRVERLLRRNASLLSSFYVIFLGTCIFIIPAISFQYAAGAGSILMVLLFLRLKIVSANTINFYKQTIYRIGQTLNRMTQE